MVSPAFSLALFGDGEGADRAPLPKMIIDGSDEVSSAWCARFGSEETLIYGIGWGSGVGVCGDGAARLGGGGQGAGGLNIGIRRGR